MLNLILSWVSAQEGTAKFASSGAAAKGVAALATGHGGHGYACVVSCCWQEGASSMGDKRKG